MVAWKCAEGKRIHAFRDVFASMSMKRPCSLLNTIEKNNNIHFWFYISKQTEYIELCYSDDGS